MPRVDVPAPGGVADAYLALPSEQSGPRPAVLMMMDAFGLRPRIQHMADRIAAHGYVVLAPNLFYRSGPAATSQLPDLLDPAARAEVVAALRPLMRVLTRDVVVADVRAYLQFLHTLPEVAAGPVGLVGYCMGGRHAVTAAGVLGGDIAAVGAFHAGGVATDDADSPHLLAGGIKAQLYFGHADNDPSMNPERIHRLEEALTVAGVTYRSEVFAGAAHGYTMSDTAAYDEQAAERSFRELFDLLDRALPLPT